MSNISTQRDGRGCEQTNESGNAPMLIAPSVSCWETWRWEVIRASMQYGKSQEAIDRLTAEQRRVTQEAGTERRSPGNTTITRSLAST
jgi:hypothetical protein